MPKEFNVHTVPELLDMAKELYMKKNAGYSGENSLDPHRNFRFSTLFGITPLEGCLVRMSDKFIRISNLAKCQKNEKVGENMKDTLMDLAIYALIAISLQEEEALIPHQKKEEII